MILIHINAKVPWECRPTVQGGWIAVCEPLGLTVQSSRYSELAEDIGDTLDLLFGDLLSNSELDEFLHAHSWTRGLEPLPLFPAEAVFDVPFELLVAGRDGSATGVYQ